MGDPAEFVTRVFADKQTEAYPAAVEAYLEVLRAEPDGRFARQLALVLPDSVRAGGGEAIVRWWRRQDPVPATPLHEGVVEHRLRVAEAEQHFAASTPAGFDARGEVFVRFGAPESRRRIDFESDLFIARAIREEPAIRSTDFPLNEVWHYPSLGPDVYFLFYRKPGVPGYQEGTTMDLLPPQLKAGGLSEQMEPRARLLGMAIRWIYKDLWLYSSDIRDRLVVLDATVGGDGSAFSGSTGLQVSNEVRRAQDEDDLALAARDEVLPPGRSRVLEGRNAGVLWRAARFLDDDGGATVLVPWAQPAAALAQAAIQTDGTALLEVAAVRYDPDYRREGDDVARRQVPLDGRSLGPELLTLRTERADGTFAVEWDLWPADAAGDPVVQGPTHATVARIDDLGELLPPGARIGLSDLLLVHPDALDGEGDRTAGDLLPLADAAVRPGQPVVVYYETYKASEGDVPVTVEVAVRERRAGGLFRPSRIAGGASASEEVLTDRRTPRLALIDDVPDADDLEISVVLTATETGERVQRTLRLPVERAP